MSNPTCAKCGSEKIIPRARVIDRGDGNSRYDLEIQVSSNPQALIFTGTNSSTVYARVCAMCGYIEFYASSQYGLWETYQESLKRR
jgi:predicted nucleic-acid-binding Zn-ribbon protein